MDGQDAPMTEREAIVALPTGAEERARVVAWFRFHATCVRIDADEGLWDGIEDQVQDSIDEFNGYADAIERGDHLTKGD